MVRVIENGDMIANVNGLSLSNADEALRLRDEARRSQRFTIKLERNGTPMTLVVRVTGSE